jgi:hypothetical protein
MCYRKGKGDGKGRWKGAKMEGKVGKGESNTLFRTNKLPKSNHMNTQVEW